MIRTEKTHNLLEQNKSREILMFFPQPKISCLRLEILPAGHCVDLRWHCNLQRVWFEVEAAWSWSLWKAVEMLRWFAG